MTTKDDLKCQRMNEAGIKQCVNRENSTFHKFLLHLTQRHGLCYFLDMKNRFWKIGELTKAVGLTVRALRFYEEIGLLRPGPRNESGHRIYGENDVVQLQKILSLKQLGIPIKEIKKLLDDRQTSSLGILQMHRKQIEDEKARITDLHQRLLKLETVLVHRGNVSVDELIKMMEAMAIYEKYLSREQLEKINASRRKTGKDRASKFKALVRLIRDKMEKDIAPTHASVQKLARKWKELLQEVSGGDRGIEKALGKIFQKERRFRDRFGFDPKLTEYVKKMMNFSQGVMEARQ
jgi:DNA-binding transcriptional MerR regulator